MKIFSVAEMIAAEQEADAHGQSYAAMMAQAGQGVAQAIRTKLEVADLRVLVLVGPGNNGGDGLVAGRYLAEAGAKVVFYLFKPRGADDPNLLAVQALNLPVLLAEFDQRYRVLRLRLNGCDIVLDALLGTGNSRPIAGELAQLLRQVRAGLIEREGAETPAEKQTEVGLTWLTASSASAHTTPTRPFVVAVDCPSGLYCDTGQLDPLALPADLTVTFAGPKQGHFLFPGAVACGELVVADIGIPPSQTSVQQVRLELATAEKIAQLMPPVPQDGHKGTFGRLLLLAGSHQYRGAAVLAGLGAFRAGAGLVAIGTPEVARNTAVVALPEATYPPLTATHQLDANTVTELAPQLPHYRALLIGPGIDQAEDFLLALLAHLHTLENAPPVVLDADALNILAQQAEWHKLLPPNSILTPHPAELARLLGQPVAEVLAEHRPTLALACAERWGCVLLLKGAYTIIAAPSAEQGSVATLIPIATPLLGTAGSGDVLAGMITALLGQGLAPYGAAVVGAWWHGRAGLSLGKRRGVLASEIATAVGETRPTAWQKSENTFFDTPPTLC
jgi:ADP-dependent NAD(P)H-hydrate dehydratase / NAD(P)H-hydrate epimerase